MKNKRIHIFSDLKYIKVNLIRIDKDLEGCKYHCLENQININIELVRTLAKRSS